MLFCLWHTLATLVGRCGFAVRAQSVSIPGAQSCLLLLWHSPLLPCPTPFLRVSLCGVALPALPRTSATENNPRAIKRRARRYTARPPERSLFSGHKLLQFAPAQFPTLPWPGFPLASRSWFLHRGGLLSWHLQWERRVSCSWHPTLKTRPPGHCCSCSCLVRPHCERHYAEVGVFVSCHCHDSKVLFISLVQSMQCAVFTVWSEVRRLLHVREGCSWSLPLQSCIRLACLFCAVEGTHSTLYNVKLWTCLAGCKGSTVQPGKCFGQVKLACALDELCTHGVAARKAARSTTWKETHQRIMATSGAWHDRSAHFGIRFYSVVWLHRVWRYLVVDAFKGVLVAGRQSVWWAANPMWQTSLAACPVQQCVQTSRGRRDFALLAFPVLPGVKQIYIYILYIHFFFFFFSHSSNSLDPYCTTSRQRRLPIASSLTLSL